MYWTLTWVNTSRKVNRHNKTGLQQHKSLSLSPSQTSTTCKQAHLTHQVRRQGTQTPFKPPLSNPFTFCLNWSLTPFSSQNLSRSETLKSTGHRKEHITGRKGKTKIGKLKLPPWPGNTEARSQKARVKSDNGREASFFGGYIGTSVRPETKSRAGKRCQYILRTLASRALSLLCNRLTY